MIQGTSDAAPISIPTESASSIQLPVAFTSRGGEGTTVLDLNPNKGVRRRPSPCPSPSPTFPPRAGHL